MPYPLTKRFLLFFLVSEFSSFLLFVAGKNIRQMQLPFNNNTSFRMPLKTPPSTPVAVDFNFQDGRVYWTDVSHNTISRSLLNGSSQEIVVSSRIKSPHGLAVDPFGQNIYWTDSTEVTIEIATLNGLYRRVLINKDLQIPVDIALDVTRGYDIGFCFWFLLVLRQLVDLEFIPLSCFTVIL